MILAAEQDLIKRVSWGSIIAGVLTVMAISLLLSTLGTSLGMSMISPKSNDIINGADTTVLIWSILSVLVSLGCGAFIAGRLAAVDGIIHGFLVWATSLIVAAILGFAAVGGLLNMTGSAIGSISSATGNIASGVANVTAKGAQGAFNAGEQIFNELGIDTNIKNQNLDQQVIEALRKSNIDVLQPEYLQSQLGQVKDELAQSVKAIALNPDNSDNIISTQLQKLKNRSKTISQSIDANDVKNALTANTSMTPEEADIAVKNFIDARNKMTQEVNEKINQLENSIEQAKQRYNEFKQEVKDSADKAANAIARISLWSFFGLLLGAALSALCGFLGVRSYVTVRRVTV